MRKKIEMTKQEDVGFTTPVTYKSYISMYGQPYKHFIMLAELIDNSISSFENHFGENEWNKPLEIDIKFDFRGEVVETKDNDLGFKYIKGSKIIFKDNGFGMSREKLKEALILDNNNKLESDKNVWGRGMKQCAYFFGQDLTVTTSDGNESNEVKQIYTSEGIDLFTPYRIEPYEIEKIEQGTTVTIENIYDRRIFSGGKNNTVLEGIVMSLEWRYVNYIKDNKLVVNYSFVDNVTKQIDDIFKVRLESKLILDDLTKEKINDRNIETIKKDLTNQYELINKKRTELNIDINIFTDAFDKLEQLFIASLAGKSEPNFEGEVKFKLKHVFDGKAVSVPFKFWALPKGANDKDAGIRFYEGKRAITHISIKDKDVGPWMGWVENSDKSWRTDKKFAGELDLKIIGAKPSVDKSMFALSEENMLKIKMSIWSVYKAYEIFMRLVMKKVEVNSKADEVKLDLDSIAASTSEHSSSNQVKLNVEESYPEEKLLTFEYNNSGNAWKVAIEFNYTENPVHILYPIKSIDDDNEFKIVVYRNHDLWKLIRSASKDNEFEYIQSVVLPIIHLIVNSSIKMNDPRLHVEKFTKGDDFIG